MSTSELLEYVQNKKGMKDETAAILFNNGVNGRLIEMAIMSNKLEYILRDMGFASSDIIRLAKCFNSKEIAGKSKEPLRKTQIEKPCVRKKAIKKQVKEVIDDREIEPFGEDEKEENGKRYKKVVKKITKERPKAGM